MSFFFLSAARSLLRASSIWSLTRRASASARRRASRSSGVSSGGGASARVSGSSDSCMNPLIGPAADESKCTVTVGYVSVGSSDGGGVHEP